MTAEAAAVVAAWVAASARGGEETAAPGIETAAEAPAAPPDVITMMAMFLQQNQAMIEMQKTMSQFVMGQSGGGLAMGNSSNHLQPARLDERCFRRLEKFTNKRDEWREWKLHLLTAVRECDTDFAESLLKYEKLTESIDLVDLNKWEGQMTAILYSRLIQLTKGEAFAIVQATQGNGCEAWRLLQQRYDPQTDGI